MCVNTGHGDERVIRAIREQAEKLTYAMPLMATEPRARLHQKLAEISPGGLQRSFFTLSGAEANEHAIKIARLATQRHKILVRYRSYHGATAGAGTLTGDPRRWAAEPGIPGVVRALDPYRYRCRWCQEQAACNLNCLNHIEDVIQFE
jgi:taurine--2-oxoglutarate transaminase